MSLSRYLFFAVSFVLVFFLTCSVQMQSAVFYHTFNPQGNAESPHSPPLHSLLLETWHLLGCTFVPLHH